MAKTQQQYYEELYNTGKKSLDKQHKTWKETDAATLEQINKSIDEATKTATGQYEQRIEAAPLESRKLYDENAVADAVAKKRVQENLANMGLTDSGLNSSMQTAMAIQKQKAAAEVRADEAAKIQAIQNTIDQIISDAAGKKSQQKMEVERATADRYNTALQNLDTTSRQGAATAYAADQDYDARVYEAQQKAASDNYAAQLKYQADLETAIKARNTAIGKAKQAIADKVAFEEYSLNDGTYDFNNKRYQSYANYVTRTLKGLCETGALPADEDALLAVLKGLYEDGNIGEDELTTILADLGL